MSEKQNNCEIINSHLIGNHYHSQTYQTENGNVVRIFQCSRFNNPEAMVTKICQDVSNISSINFSNGIPFQSANRCGLSVQIVRTYIPGSPFSEVLFDHGPRPRASSLKYAYTIIRTINELHQRGYSAGIIRPENVILTTSNDAVLVDFGVEAIYHDNVHAENKVFSFALLGPEGASSNTSTVTQARDIFQFGLLFYAFFVGHLPWAVVNLPRMLKQMTTGTIPIPTHLDCDVQELLRSMFHPDPATRPSASVIMSRIETMIAKPHTSCQPVQSSYPIQPSKSFKSLGEVIAKGTGSVTTTDSKETSNMTTFPLRFRTSGLSVTKSSRDIMLPKPSTFNFE